MEHLAVHAVVEAGKRIYDSLRPELDPSLRGKYIVIDVDSGQYEIDAVHRAASDRIRARFPQGRFYVARIGIPFKILRAPVAPGAAK
jgi:hypothetical protein